MALVRSAISSGPTCQPCPDRRTTSSSGPPRSVVSASMPVLSRGVRHASFGGILYPALTAANRSRTCATDGLTMTVPSGNTTVGTVWLPPLTDITNSHAAGSRSMSTSAISIPSRASCCFRFRQKPHHGVVYIISWPDTRRLLEVGENTGSCNTGEAGCVPERRTAIGGAVPEVAADALLAGLDPEQREVALATRGAVCVLAGAGTGKTRAITHRIAYAAAIGVVNPAHVLALTFTVRAAGEMRGRLRQLGAAQVRASTFHAAALRQLNYFWPRVIGGRPPQLIDAKAALIREAAKQARVRLDGPGLADAASEIEWAKTTQIRPDSYAPAAAAAGRSPAAGTEAMAFVYDGYERLRRERHLIDFESVLELTAGIVLEHRGAADQVHDTFRYFVVDEYQDVNPLQKLLLDAWLGDRDELCVVGDPHQVIYSFTGATPDYLTGFTAEFPGAALVRLVRDYRSTPQVVAVANQLMRSGQALIAQRPPGPQPVLTQYPDDASEAAGVAVQIRSLIAAGVPAGQIAVLVRINADTERFERVLTEATVPYVVRGTERFYERPVVRQALVLFRGAARGEAASPADPD